MDRGREGVAVAAPFYLITLVLYTPSPPVWAVSGGGVGGNGCDDGGSCDGSGVMVVVVSGRGQGSRVEEVRRGGMPVTAMSSC